MTDVLHDIKATAMRINVSPYTVRNWVATRRLACVRLGRLVRIPESEIERLIKAGTIPAKDI